MRGVAVEPSIMALTIICCTVTIVVLAAYRLFWRQRYGARGVDGSFQRVQGRVSGSRREAVLRPAGGETERRGFAVQVAGGGTCQVDLSSPFLAVVGGAIRRGDAVTVDGLPSVLAREEALYREPSIAPALEALRVARGTWPELRLLRVALGFALLLLAASLALPWMAWGQRDWILAAPLPQLRIDCPPGARQRGAFPHVWCERPAGIRHGPSLLVHECGEPVERGEYRDGAKHGLWLAYGYGGGIERRALYRAGLPAGCWEWRDWGRRRQCFEAGKLEGPSARWDDRGRLRERGSHRAGLKHGRWSEWDEEGVLRKDGEYRDGRRHGPWRFWNQDGGLAAVGRYESGAPHGVWRWWHETRHLAGVGRYARGVKQGRWTAWYPSGMREREVIYRDGGDGGRVRSWDEVVRR